jgi:hypothetical protein
MNRIWIFIVVCLFFSGGCTPANSCEKKEGGASCTRVLFIGNSYTYENDLPGVFRQLANAGGHAVETGMQAQGGWTLSDHEKSKATMDAINAQSWNYVILQDQSEVPAIPTWRNIEMYPAARVLVQQIRQKGSVPMFLMTWAHRDGLATVGLPDFKSMQYEIEKGYLQIADELDVAVAPAGYAWWELRQNTPEIDLWQSDGSHPSEKGTYVAACVLYAAIFRDSPEGLAYPFSFSEPDAKSIQSVAAEVVLAQPAQWHLP